MAVGMPPQQKFNMPAVPVWKMDPGNTNPAIPQAQRSKFYANNPWSDPYAKFNANAASQAGTWNSRALAMDPARGGGILSDPSKLSTTFDFNFPDINDPRTGADIRKWGSVLDTLTPEQQAADRLGNTGVTRAGYGGVAGAADAGAQLRGQIVRDAGSRYQDNVKTAMDFMQKRAGFNQQTAGMYLDAISKAYGITTEMAAKMMGINLEGLKASDESGTKYREDAYNAYNQDVGDYNRWNEGDAQRQWAIKQRNQQAADQQFSRDQSANDATRYQQLVSKIGKPSSSSGNAMDPAEQALLEYYGTKAGAWGKPTWEPFKLSGGGGATRAAAPAYGERYTGGKSGYFPGYNDESGAIWGAG